VHQLACAACGAINFKIEKKGVDFFQTKCISLHLLHVVEFDNWGKGFDFFQPQKLLGTKEYHPNIHIIK
jgi:hypothetical protein